MQDPISRLNELRRPPLLIRAARLAQPDYERSKALKELFPGRSIKGSRQAIILLLDEEADQNSARLDDPGRYDLSRHVKIMIALLGEARLVSQ